MRIESSLSDECQPCACRCSQSGRQQLLRPPVSSDCSCGLIVSNCPSANIGLVTGAPVFVSTWQPSSYTRVCNRLAARLNVFRKRTAFVCHHKTHHERRRRSARWIHPGVWHGFVQIYCLHEPTCTIQLVDFSCVQLHLSQKKNCSVIMRWLFCFQTTVFAQSSYARHSDEATHFCIWGLTRCWHRKLTQSPSKYLPSKADHVVVQQEVQNINVNINSTKRPV